MRKYRITLPGKYKAPTCAGYNDLEGREGHYVTAENALTAVAKVAAQFPEENEFDVEHSWKTRDAYAGTVCKDGFGGLTWCIESSLSARGGRA